MRIPLDLISGDQERLPLARRIFNSTTFSAALLLVLAGLGNLTYGLGTRVVLETFGAALFCGLLFYLSRFRGIFRPLPVPFIIFASLLLSSQWTQTGGLSGSTPTAFIVALLLGLAITEHRFHRLVTVFFLACVLCLAALDFFAPAWIASYPTEMARQFDLLIGLVLSLGMAAIVVSLLRRNYDREKATAERASRARSEFLATISHEIRTPLSAVIAHTDFLMSEQPREDQKEHLLALKFASENLLSLLNDVLDFSKIEAGRLIFEQVPFDPREVLEGVRRAFSARAREKKLGFELRISELPPLLLGDPVRMGQILNNLVSNAIKFTETGSVTIEAKMLDDRFECAVTDTGIGIPDEHRRRIFEQFTQADARTTRRFGGTGLGLAIVLRLVQSQGGSIEVASAPGAGSRFFVRLPLPVATGSQTLESPANEAPALEAFADGSILIVDDHEPNVLIARLYCEKWGLRTENAPEGRTALAMVNAKTYDLILMDLQMPVLDGIAATRAIRAMKGPSARTPIIALTAAAMFEEREAAFAAGVDDYLMKPFRPATLHEKIGRLLRPHHPS